MARTDWVYNHFRDVAPFRLNFSLSHFLPYMFSYLRRTASEVVESSAKGVCVHNYQRRRCTEDTNVYLKPCAWMASEAGKRNYPCCPLTNQTIGSNGWLVATKILEDSRQQHLKSHRRAPVDSTAIYQHSYQQIARSYKVDTPLYAPKFVHGNHA